MVATRTLSHESTGQASTASFYKPWLLATTMTLAGLVAILRAPSTACGDMPSTAPTAIDILKSRDYAAAASEVMRHIQATYYLPQQGLYAHSTAGRKPDAMWGNGIMFSALLGASRHDPATYSPIVSHFFESMDRYWDPTDHPPGYEPYPTHGGHNKYYDDNAWMVLTYVEAFEMTHDRRYLDRAQQTLNFVLSGWDDTGGGGIWWQESHKSGSKNTCSNAPAAVGCLNLAKHLPQDEAQKYRAMAEKIVTWTAKTFEDSDGIYTDNIVVASGKIDRGKLTYNTALMIRAFMGMYRATHDETYLRRAKRAASASDWFLNDKTHAYRDPVKWSHLMVEADLEMYRATQDDHLLQRAMDNADDQYATWKQHPPDELIDNAAIARILWLMADMQSAAGRQFWDHVDRLK